MAFIEASAPPSKNAGGIKNKKNSIQVKILKLVTRYSIDLLQCEEIFIS